MAKSRGIGWIGFAAVGATAYDIFEGRTEYNASYSNSLVDSTDADDTSATQGTYETSLAGDGEGTITVTGNYNGGSAQMILLAAIEAGTTIIACWGNDTVPATNPAVTDYRTTGAMVTSCDIKSDSGMQTFSATLRINVAPVAAVITDTVIASATGTKTRGRGNGYVSIAGNPLENVTALSYSAKRSEEEATDADSASWKNFLAKDFSANISGSCNDADTTTQKLLLTSCRAGTTAALIWGFRTYQASTAGKHKYAANGLITKADIKHPRGGMRTIDFDVKISGAVTRTDS